MKIFALNGSPRKQHGVTDHVLDIFLKKAEKKGAEISKHYVVDLNIKGCTGCFSCWWKTPGKCIHNDDMNWLLPEILDTDVLVWATPIYHDNMIHYLQALRERTLPLALPDFMLNESGETTHPARYKKQRRNVVIATAGFPEESAFDVIKRLFPSGLHITLPSSVTIMEADRYPRLQEFIQGVEEAAQMIVEGEEIEEDLYNKINIIYSPEEKQMIIQGHNTRSEQIIQKRDRK